MKISIIHALYFTCLMLIGCHNPENRTSKTQRDVQMGATSYDLLEANSKGLAIIKRATQLHGDLSDSTLVLSLSIKNENGIHRGQSLVPDPPYETYLLDNRFYIDRPQGEEVSHAMNNFAGFSFESFTIVKSGEGRRYDLMTYTYDKVNSSGFDRFRYFPHSYLMAALASPKSIFLEGATELKGEEVYVVAVGEGKSAQRLYFSVDSSLLLHVQTLTNYPPYGDGVSIKKFSNYEQFGSLMLPKSIYTGGTYGAWGESGNNFTLEVIDATEKNTIINSIDEFKKADYSGVNKNHLRQLGEHVYLIENISESESGDDYNILFAEFDEFILVGEAPVNNDISREAIERIQSVSNKPIRYLLQSHHHNDHWGGISPPPPPPPEYIAAEATIITTVGNQPLLDRIASAPFALAPDSQWKYPKPLSLQLVDKHFEIKDNLNAIEIYDIGPTNHSREMLIAYFPRHGILWQADLIKYDYWRLEDPRTTYFIQKVKALGLEVRTIVGVHGDVLNGDQLKSLLSND